MKEGFKDKDRDGINAFLISQKRSHERKAFLVKNKSLCEGMTLICPINR